MTRYFSLLIFFMVLIFFTPYGYCDDTLTSQQTQSNQPVQLMPSIDTGIPTVTPEQATGKFKRIVMSVYGSAKEISPHLTLLISIIGWIIGFIVKEARKVVLWAVLGMLLILWAPQIISLFLYYAGM